MLLYHNTDLKSFKQILCDGQINPSFVITKGYTHVHAKRKYGSLQKEIHMYMRHFTLGTRHPLAPLPTLPSLRPECTVCPSP